MSKSQAGRTGKFVIVGIILSLFNFLIYTLLARLVFKNNELLWIDSIISYALATVLAYILHSKITWKERPVTHQGRIMFFVWNGITAFIISPFFTWLFGFITPVYQFAHYIFTAIHIPFDYNFVESTGIFCFTTAVTMILNYLFYDKLVFNKTKLNLIPKDRKIIISILLYLLPVLFFIISYFLITTSGEDIFQGANALHSNIPLNPISDAINAFNFNSRITDMYAWAVIDFYDYQFSFGPDIFFRIIDVIMASAVFYFATYIILNRKPRLIIKDSLIFCAVFIAFIITPFGRPFYIEFSMIHNYVPLALVTLIFSIPFIKLLTKQPIGHQKLLNILMPFLGLYFGMAATITPLAFLITVIIYCIINHKKLTRPPLWFFTGIICTIIGFLICWFAGSGVEHYASSQATNFDYISLSSILSAPLSSFPTILWHEVYNFGVTLLPLLIIFIICFIFSKPRLKIKKLDSNTKNLIITSAIFIVIHILGASLIKAPFRLLIPAYLIGTIIILKTFVDTINSKLINITIVLFTIFIVFTHTFLLIKYNLQASEILTEIKNSPEPALCIEKSRTIPTRLPLIDLSQANILVDWGYPEPIYGKDITFCK